MPLRLRSAGIAVVAVGALTLGVPAPATASVEQDRKQQIERQMESLRDDLAETSAALADAVVALERAEAELPEAEQAVLDARDQLAVARARDAELADQLSIAHAEVDKAERELAATVESMAASRSVIGRVASHTYQTGKLAELAVVFQAESIDDLAARLALSQAAIRSEGAALVELAADRADLDASRRTLEAKRDQVAGTKAEQEQVVADVAHLEREAVASQERVEQLVADRAQARAAIEAEKAAEQHRIAEMEAESQRLQNVLEERARIAREREARERAEQQAGDRAEQRAQGGAGSQEDQRSASPPAPMPEPAPAPAPELEPDASVLLRPVNGRLSSGYGMRVNPVTGVYKLHAGLDWAAPSGTPVRAAADGVVVQASPAGGYGNQVALDHGLVQGVGLATSYSHLSGFAVSPGQSVSRGDVVGYVGSTGNSTGPHLHFEVYENGRPVNPAGWV